MTTCECSHPASSIHGVCHKCHNRMPKPTHFGTNNEEPKTWSKRNKQPRGRKAQVKRDLRAKMAQK